MPNKKVIVYSVAVLGAVVVAFLGWQVYRSRFGLDNTSAQESALLKAARAQYGLKDDVEAKKVNLPQTANLKTEANQSYAPIVSAVQDTGLNQVQRTLRSVNEINHLSKFNQQLTQIPSSDNKNSNNKK